MASVQVERVMETQYAGIIFDNQSTEEDYPNNAVSKQDIIRSLKNSLLSFRAEREISSFVDIRDFSSLRSSK